MLRQIAQKQVLVSKIFGSKIEASKKADSKVEKRSELYGILYIHNSAQFSEFFVKTLIDSGSKANVIQPSFVRKLGFCTCKATLDVQKIDANRLETLR